MTDTTEAQILATIASEHAAGQHTRPMRWCRDCLGDQVVPLPPRATEAVAPTGRSPSSAPRSGFQRLGATLGKVLQARGKLSDAPVEPSPPEAPPDGGPYCDVCRGFRWLGRDVARDHPDFGVPIPCPACAIGIATQRRLDQLLEELPERLRSYTLDNFKTPTPVYAEYLASVRRWVADPGSPWLFLSGAVSRGKTHLAVGAMRAWVEANHSATFSKVDALLDRLHRGYKVGDYDAIMRSLVDVELVVLDDLGAEHRHSPDGDWSAEKLFQLIGGRYDANRRMVITSNLTIKDISDHLGHPRIARRIHEMSSPEYALNADKLPYRADWRQL